MVVTSDILGTGSLLDMWERGPFVFASSQMVYGVPTAPATEDTPVQPTSSWFDMGKYINEFQLGATCERNARGAGIALRIPAVLSASRGKFQTLDMLYNDMVRGATFIFESDEALETSGSDFIGVRDLAKGMVSSLDVKKSGAYNVRGGYFTWKELLDGLVKLTGTKGKFMIRPGGVRGEMEAQVPQRQSRLDDSRFREAVPDFTPRRRLSRSLKSMLLPGASLPAVVRSQKSRCNRSCRERGQDDHAGDGAWRQQGCRQKRDDERRRPHEHERCAGSRASRLTGSAITY